MGLFDRIFSGNSQDSSDPLEFRQLCEKAVSHVQALTTAHEGVWHIGEASWGADLEAGIITFDSPNGMQVEAPVQVIGTYNTDDETWLWGWEHPSVPPPLDQHAQLVLDYGRKNSVPDLTTRNLQCSTDRCWEFTAVACLLAEAQGVYIGPSGPTLVYMTFGAVKLSKGE